MKKSAPKLADPAATEPVREVVVDDPSGDLQWASPTGGKPVSLEWTPAGSPCMLYMRPHQLLGHNEAAKVLVALGPWGAEAISWLQSVVKAELSEIDALLVSAVVLEGNGLDACLRATLVTPWDKAALAERVGGERRQRDGFEYYVAAELSYLLVDGGKSLVVGQQATIEHLIDEQGDAPMLSRDIELLVEHTDDRRDATILLGAGFLQSSGSDLFKGNGARVREALQHLLGHESTAAAISAHWGEHFFIELQAAPALSVPPRRLAVMLADRIEAWPRAAEALIRKDAASPYGAAVVARFPQMVNQLSRHLRSGGEQRVALLRAYLPVAAGHNLLMAGELAVADFGPNVGIAAAKDPEDSPIEARLARRTSLAFSKDSLGRALELLASDVGVEMAVAGADLQLDGITKNQSFTIDMRNQPAGEILVEILRRANPDRTATGPGDPRQKLVYVIEASDGHGPGRIIVTTRAGVERRGYRLPAIFLSSPR